jgi:hypothetical protein
MDTKLPVIMVLSLAVASMMWSASGIGAELTTNPASGLSSGDDVESQANQSEINDEGNYTGPVGGDDEGNIIGLILSGASSIAGVFGLALLLPEELMALGIPQWAAMPLGFLAQIIVGIGIVQFVTGRVFR